MMDEYTAEMDAAGCYVNPFVGEGRYAYTTMLYHTYYTILLDCYAILSLPRDGQVHRRDERGGLLRQLIRGTVRPAHIIL